VTGLAAFTILVGLVGLERIAELVVSTRNAAWSLDRGGVETGADLSSFGDDLVGFGGTGLQPLLEQSDFGDQVVITPREVCEAALRVSGLP